MRRTWWARLALVPALLVAGGGSASAVAGPNPARRSEPASDPENDVPPAGLQFLSNEQFVARIGQEAFDEKLAAHRARMARPDGQVPEG